jgi:CDP-diacylglycerol--serine O-phosphatidyltransferase
LQNAAHHPLVSALVLIGTALLLVSSLPVWSFKNFKVPSQYVLPIFLGTMIFAALLIADPWAGLAAAGVIYAGMLPFSVRSYHRLRRAAEDEG